MLEIKENSTKQFSDPAYSASASYSETIRHLLIFWLLVNKSNIIELESLSFKLFNKQRLWLVSKFRKESLSKDLDVLWHCIVCNSNGLNRTLAKLSIGFKQNWSCSSMMLIDDDPSNLSQSTWVLTRLSKSNLSIRPLQRPYNHNEKVVARSSHIESQITKPQVEPAKFIDLDL